MAHSSIDNFHILMIDITGLATFHIRLNRLLFDVPNRSRSLMIYSTAVTAHFDIDLDGDRILRSCR